MNAIRQAIAWSLLSFILTLAPPAAADPAMTFIYSDGQAELGHIKRFHWKVLEAALERTRASHGDYKMVALPPMPVSRQEYELAHESPVITVAVFNSTAERTGKLLPVRIPVDFGLLSYRVLLIREGDQDRFDRIATLGDLAALQFGVMPGWSDGKIMRAAGLPVVEGDNYDGLYRMLAAGRFDAFSRGASEIIADFDRAKSLAPGLAIEKHLLLHYPMPIYFWFADTPEGRRRADRVRAGLAAMVEDGSLAAMIREHYRADIAALDLAGRRVIELPNPLLDGRDPPVESGLWFHP
jgi:hypothetical protein